MIHNPLLTDFDTKHNTPPFKKIKTEHFEPAFEQTLELAKIEVGNIAQNTQKPTFENTIEAIELCGQKLNKVAEIFFNLNHANTNKDIQKLAQEVSPKLSEFSNDIYLNPDIFKKVEQIYNSKAKSKLNEEQIMLLDKTYKAFIRNGAKLNDEEKNRFREITKKLSVLQLQFTQNVMEETNKFSLHITNYNDLSGLPEYVLEAAEEQAKEDNKSGWVFNLQFPSYIPFMQYADNRELRKKMFDAYSSRCNKNNELDNKEIISQIVNLRLEKAKLLGAKNYASFVLQERMAQNEKTVISFLNNLFEASMPVAHNEVDAIKKFAKEQGADFELQKWDWSYYSEKLKKETFDISDEMTKPYFELGAVVDAVFNLANTLFDIRFEQSYDIEVYHEDVKAYEVFDNNNDFVAVFYLDFHPRPSKQGGAWMTSYSEQYVHNGIDHRPHVSLVCNFTKPTATNPSLLTFSEVETFLHEFGHGLHGMLSKCTYQSLSGTNVYRDFVELPSQLMENWATEKEWLKSFAKHYKTGETIPDELVEKIIASKKYLAGYQSVRQISFGLNDMAWHTITSDFMESVSYFERKAMEKTELLPSIPDALMSTAFSHIFGGGYAAGYYGYKWAEVLDADAFEEFKKNGIFDKNTAKKYKECILEKGGSKHPMDLYKDFKGREPSVEALLKREGLIKK